MYFRKIFLRGYSFVKSQDFQIELRRNIKLQKKGLYRMYKYELKEVKEKINELLEWDLIRRSTSLSGASILFAARKDGSLRFCIDNRFLNRINIKNSYRLIRKDDIQDQLATAKIFTITDLRPGYHQIRLGFEYIRRTSFNTRYENLEILVLRLRICNEPAIFMDLMNSVSVPYSNEIIIIYLDGILTYSD